MKKWLILTLAVMLGLAAASPAWAVDTSTYTFELQARMLTDIGWWNKSQELTNNGSDDVGTWFLTLPGHSYLQARFYSVDKNVGGRIELGLKSVQPDATVSLRYAYAYWRVGNCRILAGQTDNWFGSLAYHIRQYVGLEENAHLLMFGWGFLWPHRVPQVQFTYNTDKWGIQFALEEPRQKTNLFDAGGTTDAAFMFPRASLTLMFRYGGFMTHPGFNFVNHKYESGSTGAFDDSYNTWAFVLPIKYTIGAFTLKFQGHYGINFATEYPFFPVDLTQPYRNGIDTGGIDDTTIYGGVLAGEYQIGKIMVTGGVGYENFSNDAWSGKNGYSKDENVRLGAFIAVPYQFTKNFGVHPEFSYYSYGDDPKTGNGMGNEWLLGVQFRFVF
ncbi:MAG: hypothetical protein KQH53_19505 [Desulfarculaceae bacterium]|nr:hypothetical protein [Desulfarculaceae bacterium]